MTPLQDRLHCVLRDSVGEILARAVLVSTVKASGLNLAAPRTADVDRFLSRLAVGLHAHLRDEAVRTQCLDRVRSVLCSAKKSFAHPDDITTVIRTEYDILAARKAGQDLCIAAGFPVSIQIRVATAISELARNIAKYTSGGEVVVSIKPGEPPVVEVVARDSGPGIGNVDQILRGDYVSKTGMGRGLLGVKALMDEVEIDSVPGRGTTITARKRER